MVRRVGATLALALSKAGLAATLIDPQPFEAQLAPTFDGRASAIAFASFRLWRTLGLAADLEPHAQRIEQEEADEKARFGEDYAA